MSSIKCPECGRVYGEYRDGYIYQVEGKNRKPPNYPKVQRIFGGMSIGCENCGYTFDVPATLRNRDGIDKHNIL